MNIPDDIPTVKYPKRAVRRINRILRDSEKQLKAQKPYADVRKMFADMGIFIDDDDSPENTKLTEDHK